jgi:SAM-dependent methyltransferase
MSNLQPSDPSGLETLEKFSKATAINRWLYEKISPDLGGKILEIGSGIGNISEFLLKYNRNVSLSDFRTDYCTVLKNKFEGNENLDNIYQMDFSLPDFKLRYSDLLGAFDTVVALNVVEHIENDFLALRNAKDLLKKNGRIIVLVPAGQWLYNKLDRELGHFKRYSKKSLLNLFESVGCKVISLKYFNSVAMLGWWLAGNVQQKKIIPASQLDMYNRFVPVFRFADWFISPFAGISLIAVGINNTH